MKLDKVFQFLLPKEVKFFPLFPSAAANLINCRLELRNLLNCTVEEKRSEHVRNVKSF